MSPARWRARAWFGAIMALATIGMCPAARTPKERAKKETIATERPVVVDVPATATAALGAATAGSGLGAKVPEKSSAKKTTGTLERLSVTLETTRPLALRFGHEIEYTPEGGEVKVVRGEWTVDQLALGLFGGAVAATGRGQIEQNKFKDVASSVTVKRLNVQKLLELMDVPRAREVEAILSGNLAVEVVDGKWRRMDVELLGEEGSGKISRYILRDMLAPALGGGLEWKSLNATLDQFYKGQEMIPLEGLRMSGSLTGGTLKMRLPLHNPALNIDFEPNVDQKTLWWAWDIFQKKGMKNLMQANWDLDMDNKRVPNTKN